MTLLSPMSQKMAHPCGRRSHIHVQRMLNLPLHRRLRLTLRSLNNWWTCYRHTSPTVTGWILRLSWRDFGLLLQRIWARQLRCLTRNWKGTFRLAERSLTAKSTLCRQRQKSESRNWQRNTSPTAHKLSSLLSSMPRMRTGCSAQALSRKICWLAFSVEFSRSYLSRRLISAIRTLPSLPLLKAKSFEFGAMMCYWPTSNSLNGYSTYPSSELSTPLVRTAISFGAAWRPSRTSAELTSAMRNGKPFVKPLWKNATLAVMHPSPTCPLAKSRNGTMNYL